MIYICCTSEYVYKRTAARINNLTTLWSLFNTRSVWEVFFSISFLESIIFETIFCRLNNSKYIMLSPSPSGYSIRCSVQTYFVLAVYAGTEGLRRRRYMLCAGTIHRIIAGARLKFHYELNRFLVYIPSRT